MIIMLTAEFEGGQIKCHPYWKEGVYGNMKVQSLSEKRVLLDTSTDSPKVSGAPKRPSIGRRRSTNPSTAGREDTRQDVTSPASDVPHVIIRKLALSHAGDPFAPIREITQLQYSCWPDFGVPAHPTHILSLIEQCNAIVRTVTDTRDALDPEPPGQMPAIVHCSAGCGRTGTFVTIDSVLDMLKRQRHKRARKASGEEMDIDDDDDWVDGEDVDLIAKTVEDLRVQRLSMVQSLRQFVLCYETVLEWLVRQEPEKVGRDRKGGMRSS